MIKQLLSLSLVCFLCSVNVTGQNFIYHSDAPFGIQLARESATRPRVAQQVQFYDYDHDGDQDLLLTGLDTIEHLNSWDGIRFFIEIQNNIGDAQHPQFGPRDSIFEDFPFPHGYFSYGIGDLNADHKPDLIAGADIDWIGNQSFSYMEGVGTKGNQFESTRLDAMGLYTFVPDSYKLPELVDMDTDGDLDILFSGYDSAVNDEEGANIPVFYYARNKGTKNEPLFEGWYFNPYGLTPDENLEVATTGDIDNDGDIDVLGVTLTIPADSLNQILVHVNEAGPDGRPSFDTIPLSSPFGLPTAFGENQYLAPELVDIDGDGDMDFFVYLVTAEGFALQYYENTLCASETSELSVTLCEGDVFKFGGTNYTAPGNYTVHLESSNGCDSIVLLSIDLELPSEFMLNEAICEGETFTVGTETFTETGDYTVFITGANGCDSIVHLSLNVIHLDQAITVNGPILTANQSFGNYQWIDCDSGENISGATNQSFEVTETGNYAVIISGAGCTVQSACQFVMITGIDHSLYDQSIHVYPVPANDVIYIRNNTPYTIDKIKIFTVSGELPGGEYVPTTNAISLRHLSPGVYYARVHVNGSVVIKKVVKM